MNETVRSLLERRSVRKYQDKPVSREDLETIVNCGQFAATGRGSQPWHFTVVSDRRLLDKITALNVEFLKNMPENPMHERALQPRFDNFHGAPNAIIVSGETENVLAAADCAGATQNMTVAAWSLGIGSCYIASFKMALLATEGAALCKELGIPDGYVPQFAVALGYADETPPPRIARKEGAINWIG